MYGTLQCTKCFTKSPDLIHLTFTVAFWSPYFCNTFYFIPGLHMWNHSLIYFQGFEKPKKSLGSNHFFQQIKGLAAITVQWFYQSHAASWDKVSQDFCLVGWLFFYFLLMLSLVNILDFKWKICIWRGSEEGEEGRWGINWPLSKSMCLQVGWVPLGQ